MNRCNLIGAFSFLWQIIAQIKNISVNERAMRISKIFPAAAGVIALTATVSFARDQREFEEGDFCRTRIGNCNATANPVDCEKKLIPISKENANGNVYVVEIARGDKTWMVFIDAYTGKVLERRDLQVAAV